MLPSLFHHLTWLSPLGTGITVYGKTDSLTNGALYLELDGTPDQIRLNGTTFGDGVAPIYHVENLGDDDHQLVGNVPVLVNGTILMDHFECGRLVPIRLKESMLIISLVPGLKIRLEAASTFSMSDQLRGTYPRRR